MVLASVMRAVGFSVLCVSGIQAQTDRPEVAPLPLIDSDSLKPARKLQPGMLTSGEKAEMTFRNMISPRTVANRMIWTGINQWRDHPAEWDQDLGGFGQRLANRYGRMAIRNSLMLGLDVAFKTDSRYDRCDCDGFFPRTGHAFKRTIVSRKDYGGEMLSAAKLAGAYVTPMITDQWYPARLNTWEHKLTSGSSYLLWRGTTNMLKEFWPDIRRGVFKKKD